MLNYLNAAHMKGEEIRTEDVAASFQRSVVDVLVSHSMRAVEEFHIRKFAIAGGVASNSALRAAMEEACRKKGIRLYVPEPVLCTDNGAMIAAAAYYKYRKQGADGLDLDAYASLPL